MHDSRTWKEAKVSWEKHASKGRICKWPDCEADVLTIFPPCCLLEIWIWKLLLVFTLRAWISHAVQHWGHMVSLKKNIYMYIFFTIMCQIKSSQVEPKLNLIFFFFWFVLEDILALTTFILVLVFGAESLFFKINFVVYMSTWKSNSVHSLIINKGSTQGDDELSGLFKVDTHRRRCHPWRDTCWTVQAPWWLLLSQSPLWLPSLNSESKGGMHS